MSYDGRAGGESAIRTASAGDRVDPRIEEYASVLREQLTGDLGRLIEFFADPRRLDVMAQLLSRHFSRTPAHVLNVGCGPCATEFFLKVLRPHAIVSFDYTREFAPVYAALRARGHLGNTSFFIADVLSAEFVPERFDLIIMHDVLYEPALDLSVLFPQYDRFLRPGGLFLITLLDARTRWIWKLLGREQPHKRYEIPAALAEIAARGYQVLECVPASLQARGRWTQAFKRLLWHGLGLSNEMAILARKAVR